MEYKIGGKNRSNHFLDFELSIQCEPKKKLQLLLPKWRPGRYEIGNFAKNIRAFSVSDENGKSIPYKKTESHCWEINPQGAKMLKVSYQVYANELNAGSSYTDGQQIYINPINCCMYAPQYRNHRHQITFEVPQNYIFATSLQPVKESVFEAANYDELVDAPVISSPDLKHGSFKLDNHTFHLWFQGECQPDWKKLSSDFAAFAKKQIDDFGTAPFKNFHFLFQITPYPSYHGVEHQNSTVITLGPGYQLMEDTLYKELLGVSSHELYHAWNVKSIRPEAMLPYDYQNENYTELGYVTEGFTTYFGDLYLSKAGLVSEKAWFDLIHQLLDRHSLNYGRFNYSVSESSFDTWLDGYVKGIPNRKTSIYVEGALIAWILDLEILQHTNGKTSLSHVLKVLYEKYGRKTKGINETQIIAEIKELTGKNFSVFFDHFYHNALDIYNDLAVRLTPVGLKLEKVPHEHFAAKTWGILLDKNDTIVQLAPDSPAEKAGFSVGDQIRSIKGISCKNNANAWFNYFKLSQLPVIADGMGLQKHLYLEKPGGSFFEKYRISKNPKATDTQKNLFEIWCN